MTDVRAEGTVTALASISHGGEHAGTAQFLRREKFVQPDGAVVDIPVISGNSVRGVLRDISAQITWEALGRPDLPLPVFHALWSGGSLAKAGSGKVLGAQQLRRLRELVPHVSLFGCAGGGRIIEGRLQVGKMVPCVRETAHVLPAELAARDLPSVWDVLQLEEFTRTDDAKRLSIAAVPRPALPAGQTALLLGEAETPPSEDDGPAQQMRYGIETLAAGTVFHWWVALRGATDLEVAQFSLTLAEWMASGAHVGGRSSSGHGRLHADMDRWQHGTPELTTTGTGLGQPADVGAHLRNVAAEAVEALGWLA